MSAPLTGVALFLAFHLLGAGLALRLAAWADLPPRFLVFLTSMSTAALSFALFWLSYLAPRFRSTAVAATVLASAISIAIACVRSAERARLLSTEAWLPLLLSAGLCAAWLPPLLSRGPTINDRFAWTLPSDNILPGLIAYSVLTSTTGTPRPLLGPGGDRASERPPLQAAVTVAVGTLVRGSDDEYQILATLCQAQWAPALLLLGLTAGLTRRAIVFVLVACVFSGFFFVNTVYTWPKLFAASLMLGALAIAMEAPSPRAATGVARVALAAVGCALSLLAHPGPIFTILAVPLCWTILRPILRLTLGWKAGALAGAVVVATLAPWAAYQTFIDPPTGRLLREHLGDGRTGGTVAGTLLAANLERAPAEHVRARLGNLAMQVGNPLIDVWPGSPGRGQHEQFFRYGSALGVLVIGLIAALWRAGAGVAPGAAGDVVRRLGLFALVSLCLWSVMVFSPGNAVIHHSSPVTAALVFFAAGYGMARLPTALGVGLIGIHAAAAIYIWFWPALNGK